MQRLTELILRRAKRESLVPLAWCVWRAPGLATKPNVAELVQYADLWRSQGSSFCFAIRGDARGPRGPVACVHVWRMRPDAGADKWPRGKMPAVATAVTPEDFLEYMQTLTGQWNAEVVEGNKGGDAGYARRMLAALRNHWCLALLQAFWLTWHQGPPPQVLQPLQVVMLQLVCAQLLQHC